MKSGNFFFEFEDLSWFPHTIRESMTDYLRYLLTTLDLYKPCLLYTSDAADERSSVDLGGRRIIKKQTNKKKKKKNKTNMTKNVRQKIIRTHDTEQMNK